MLGTDMDESRLPWGWKNLLFFLGVVSGCQGTPAPATHPLDTSGRTLLAAKQEAPAPFRAMTFNVRRPMSEDSCHSSGKALGWLARREQIVLAILHYAPDILALQELSRIHQHPADTCDRKSKAFCNAAAPDGSAWLSCRGRSRQSKPSITCNRGCPKERPAEWLSQKLEGHGYSCTGNGLTDSPKLLCFSRQFTPVEGGPEPFAEGLFQTRLPPCSHEGALCRELQKKRPHLARQWHAPANDPACLDDTPSIYGGLKQMKRGNALGGGRSATFLRLRHSTGRTLLVVNTHLHHKKRDESVRSKQVECVGSWLRWMTNPDNLGPDTPVLLLGDLNTVASSPSYLRIEDTFRQGSGAPFTASVGETPQATFNGFDWTLPLGKPVPGKAIDHIFSRNLKRLNYQVGLWRYPAPSKQNEKQYLWPSDHMPVAAEFVFPQAR